MSMTEVQHQTTETTIDRLNRARLYTATGVGAAPGAPQRADGSG